MTNLTASALIVLALPALAAAQAGEPAWKAAESRTLTHHVQLTTRERFLKAGEAYFGPGDWIIFQAIPAPEPDRQPDPFYSMYVAKLKRDADGHIGGIGEPIRVSPPGSANTCGWFHPKLPGGVIFGSTITPPATDQHAGFQVGTRKYVWLFPKEMDIVGVGVREVFADVAGKNPHDASNGHLTPQPIFTRPEYDAECSYSADGRFILYAHVRESEGQEGAKADADIWIYDTQTRRQHPLVVADGYDGGPFFSPDGKRICYRSDRKHNDLLQLFVADLKFDESGVPVGITREYQLTDNEHVNWGPFWHPSGKFLAYSTSEVGHDNYEVFAIEIDDAKLAADAPTGSRAADTLQRRRLTFAPGADVLPAFSSDGKVMMWTSQRGPMVAGEQRPSSQLWVAEFIGDTLSFEGEKK